MSVEIKVNDRQLKRIASALDGIPRAMPKVVSRAINRTATQGRRRVVKAAAAASGLTQKVVRQDVRLLRASYKKWRARLFFESRRRTLRHREHRLTPQGVVYSGLAGRNQRLPSAFGAVMPTGYRSVWERLTRSRLPIEEVRDELSMVEFAEQEGLIKDVELFSREALVTQLDTQMRVLLDQMRNRRKVK